MPRITSKSDLNHGTEFTVDTGTLTITISAAGNLSSGSANGVVGQALFSAVADYWKSGAGLNAYQFPLAMADGPTATMLEFREGWSLAGISLLRSCGVAYKNTSGTVTDEWACFVQLGSLKTATDQPYHLLDGTVPSNFGVADEFNECLKIYESGSFDYRSSPTAQFYVRTAGDTYGGYDLISEQNLTALTYRAYSVPMTTATDTSLSVTNPSGAPYSGMSLTLGATTATINSTVYNFAEGEIDANSGTVQQVYDWFQNLLLQSTDIDSGAGTQRGDTYLTGSLSLSGGVLTTSQGLVVKNISGADTNNVINVDDTGTGRQEAFTPTITINVVDSDGISVNAPTGARLLVYDVTNTNTLINSTDIAGSSSDSVSWTGTGTASIRVEWNAVNGATSASKHGQAFTSITDAASIVVNIVFEDNTIYVSNNYDGSTDTDCTIDANKIDVTVNTGGGAVDEKPFQEIYNWYMYYQNTAAGILDSDFLITANTQVDYTIDNTLEIANGNPGTHLSITNAYIQDQNGTIAGWMDQSGGGTVGYIAPSIVAFSTGSVTQSDVLAIKAKTDLLSFNNGNVASNIKEINDAAVAGSGTSEDKWR